MVIFVVGSVKFKKIFLLNCRSFRQLNFVCPQFLFHTQLKSRLVYCLTGLTRGCVYSEIVMPDAPPLTNVATVGFSSETSLHGGCKVSWTRLYQYKIKLHSLNINSFVFRFSMDLEHCLTKSGYLYWVWLSCWPGLLFVSIVGNRWMERHLGWRMS